MGEYRLTVTRTLSLARSDLGPFLGIEQRSMQVAGDTLIGTELCEGAVGPEKGRFSKEK